MNQKFIAVIGVIAMLLSGSTSFAKVSKADAEATLSAPGKTITVSGVVTDAKGEALPGASVLVKGTTKGTITDLDGKYTITAQEGETLVVSFIGFKDQEFVAGQGAKNIALATDSTILDDVVVVGYGTAKKANLTGSVDQISSETFENRPISNMQQMMAGSMPNVSAQFSDGKPSRTTTFIVRGTGSIANINTSSDGNALVLIDGVEGDPELLNPNDIESVSVLKDAASAAIYGSRGPYGVILITTKDPSKTSGKVTVTYSANANFGTPTTIPDVVTDGLQYAKLAEMAYYNWNDNNTGLAHFGSTQYFFDANGNASNVGQYVKDFEAWRAAGNTGIVDVDKAGKYHYYASTNWYDELYKDYAFSQIHNVSVSGTMGKVSYMVSGRLYAYDGLYKYDADTYKTNNIRAKISAPVFPWLKLTENMEYTVDKLHQPVSSGTGVSSVFDATECFAAPETYLTQKGFPTMPVYNPDGTLTYAGAYVFGAMINKESYVNVTKKNFRTTTGLDASFFDNHWRFHADYTYRDKNSDKTIKKTGVEYSEKVGEIKNILNETKLRQQFLSDYLTFYEEHTVNAYTEYENTWGKNYFKGMVGYNYESKLKTTSQYAKRGLTYTSADNYAFCQGEWVDGAFDDKPYKFKTGYNKRRESGVFFRVNYAFDDRYLIEIDGRYDGSSKFPAGRQWNFFPSGSIGWRVSQEPWWNVNPNAISNLKLRASYGSLGDSASIGAYNFEEVFDAKNWAETRVIDGNATSSYFGYPGETNSAYSWSTVTTTDFGIDMGFLRGKLNITGDYYIRRTTNMLVDAANYPEAYGSDAAKDNAGAMSTYGWEVVANYADQFMVAGKPFSISARFSIGDNHTIVDYYKNDTNSIDEWAFRSGQNFGEIWGYRVNPDSPFFQTQEQINTAFGGQPYVNTLIKTNKAGQTRPGDLWLLDLNGNGKIDKGENTADDPGDREIIGNVCARYTYGFGFDLAWNGFFLNASFDGVGRQDWSPVGKTLFWGLYGNQSRQMLKWTANNMWSEDNPNALFPRLSVANKYFDGSYNHWSCYMNKYPLDKYIFNIGYLRLQNLQIGYNLPKSLTQKINLSNVKVYVSGENLFTLSPFYKYTRDFDVMTINSHGDDPANGINWSSASVGAQYPMLRTYSIGVVITY